MAEKQKNTAPAVRETPQKIVRNTIFYCLAFLALLGMGGLLYLSFGRGTEAVRQAFETEKAAAEEEVYHGFYEQGYRAGENEYHVKNRAVITLGKIRETAVLEVLSVSDIVYIIQDPDIKNGETLSWLQVPGTGVFTVNLASGEFLADDERALVYVRLPRPELLPMNITIDHANVKPLRFSSSILLSSVQEGEQLAGKQLNEARARITEDISSNLQFYEFAEDSARTLLENLIRMVNSDIPDLKVEIEFY